MLVEKYFSRFKVIVDRYSQTPYLIEIKLNFDARPGDQGYLKGSIYFKDKSILYFSEFLDVLDAKIDKLMYTYHYQNEENELIFRYDNSAHKPALSFQEHKHLPEEIIPAAAPGIEDVLLEIIMLKKWTNEI